MDQQQKIIDELVFLDKVRIQKVWGLFNSILVFELFSPLHKRVYFLFDQNPQTASTHVQKSRPVGLKTISPLILAIKKRGIGSGLKFFKESSDNSLLVAQIASDTEDCLVIFNTGKSPWAALLENNKIVISSGKNDLKVPHLQLTDTHTSTSLESNFAQSKSHEFKVLNFYKNYIYQLQSKDLNKAIKKKKNLINNILQDRQKFEADLLLSRQADLLKMNFNQIKSGASEILLWDYYASPPQKILINLDKKLKPKEQLDNLYKKSKRAKRGIFNIDNRIKDIQDDLTALQNKADALLTASPDSLTLSQFANDKSSQITPKKAQIVRLPYREFVSSDGIKIWVGRSAKDSDLLTKQFAKGNDWWFHARDTKGAHVVVKHPNSELPQTTFLESAMLAAHFSHAKDEPKVTISYTQAKNVKKQKGLAVGQVLVSHEKTAEIRMDCEVLALLLAQIKPT